MVILVLCAFAVPWTEWTHPRDYNPSMWERLKGGMRFNYAEAGTDPSFYIPLARACEEAGYDGFIVPDGR